jgi:hypothetical protein
MRTRPAVQVLVVAVVAGSTRRTGSWEKRRRSRERPTLPAFAYCSSAAASSGDPGISTRRCRSPKRHSRRHWPPGRTSSPATPPTWPRSPATCSPGASGGLSSLVAPRRPPTGSATLLNNLGWRHAQRGEHTDSLAAYRGSLEAHEQNARYPCLREVARVGVARALRNLGRTKQALPLLEQAVAWAQAGGRPDRAFHDELAAAYADLGPTDEATDQERLSALAGPGQLALWQSRPRPPRSDPGS